MDSPRVSSLISLEDADLTVADPAEDIRGRSVIDRDGEEFGHVKSLLIDEDERRVRLLELSSGGVLGLGAETPLVPVDAIAQITADAVHIDRTKEDIRGAPPYDPELGRRADYVGDVYGYYGLHPFWMAGFTYPSYPCYR